MDAAWQVDSSQSAELLAAEHMATLGFVGVRLTPPGIDAGIDVISTEGIAQVKHYSSSAVGRPDVQRLRGAAGSRRWILFYSLAGYTKSASDFAEEAGVALFRYDRAGHITACNELALTLAGRGSVSLDRSQASASRAVLATSIGEFGQASADAAVVALHVLNKHLAADVAALRAGHAPSFVTPTEVPALMRKALALQSASQLIAHGDEVGRSFGDGANGLLDLEALVQELVARVNLDYEEVSRAGRTLRAGGFLGQGLADDRLPVDAHLAAASSASPVHSWSESGQEVAGKRSAPSYTWAAALDAPGA